jgi:hypothetical protein
MIVVWRMYILGILPETYCRLNMEVHLQSLFGLHVTWCAPLYSLAETPQLPPPPRILDLSYEGAIGQQW